jgi:hypothetical protein
MLTKQNKFNIVKEQQTVVCDSYFDASKQSETSFFVCFVFF